MFNENDFAAFSNLKPAIKEKAIEIANTLAEDEIPVGSDRVKTAIRLAQEWFTDLEG
ncbi:hypothetical protein ABDD95_07145 [Mucilaginibacter sp. PAMB04274]|uniref:hypothetical protein n=1 Tax=Mucilaginibacter sp. PAMB04274 TaxID=3138568 RepID=UPI0031F66BA8